MKRKYLLGLALMRRPIGRRIDNSMLLMRRRQVRVGTRNLRVLRRHLQGRRRGFTLVLVACIQLLVLVLMGHESGLLVMLLLNMWQEADGSLGRLVHGPRRLAQVGLILVVVSVLLTIVGLLIMIVDVRLLLVLLAVVVEDCLRWGLLWLLRWMLSGRSYCIVLVYCLLLWLHLVLYLVVVLVLLHHWLLMRLVLMRQHSHVLLLLLVELQVSWRQANFWSCCK